VVRRPADPADPVDLGAQSDLIGAPEPLNPRPSWPHS